MNRQGGILGRRIELILYDDTSDPKAAVSFARKLIDQNKVDVVIGGSITGTTGVLTSTAAYDMQSGSVTAILGGTVVRVGSTVYDGSLRGRLDRLREELASSYLLASSR